VQLRSKLVPKEDELGAKILAVDPHEQYAANFLLKEVGLKTSDVRFPLLLDPAQVVSATYGVAFQMRIHVEESNRPATFIIDKNGSIRYARRGKTYGDRPKTADIEAELKKLQ